MINAFNKVSGYKINIGKSVASLYTNDKHLKRNQRNNSILKTTRKIKCFRINLAKETKGFYNENLKTTKKEIEEDTRQNDLLYLCIGRANFCQNGQPTESNLHSQ